MTMSDTILGHANLKHPFADHSLADAVKIANNIKSLSLQRPVATLAEAREVIREAAKSAGHVWITGSCALDVLDAAIDGKDLSQRNRIC